MPANHRREKRTFKKLPVEIRGTDEDGKPFTEIVRTLDISLKGARLEWVSHSKGPSSSVQVEHRGKNVEFRVAWKGKRGTSQEKQIGLECLEPAQNIWDLPTNGRPDSSSDFPPDPDKPVIAPVPFVASWGGEERRKSSRYHCSGGLEVCEEGAERRMTGTLSDVSLGGCYMETRTPLPVETRVGLALKAKDLEVRGKGEVRVCHPGMGMGIAFRELSETDQQRLDRLIKRLKPEPPAGAEGQGEEPAVDATRGDMADAFQVLLELLHRKGVLTRGDFLEVLERVKTAPTARM